MINKTDQIICQEKYKLNPKQQELVRRNRNTNNILDLAKDVYNDPSIGENSEEMKNVRAFVIRCRKKQESYNFTDAQLEQISQKAAALRPIDMARYLFPNSETNLTREAKTIANLYKAWKIVSQEEIDEARSVEVENDSYSPPDSFNKALALINRIVPEADFSTSKLNDHKTNCIKTLWKNLKSVRFILMINSYKRKMLRDLFESEFVKGTYDKPDLNSEETNMYIMLCGEYVLEVTVTENISDLNDRLHEDLTDSTPDARRFSKTLSDSLASKINELNNCKTRQKNLMTSLSGSRFERLKSLKEANESLAKFVQLAQEEKGRNALLRLAEAKNLEIEKEAVKIQSFGDMIAQVHGLSIEEIVNF